MNHRHEGLPIGTVAVVGPGRVGTVVAAGLAAVGHEVVVAIGGSPTARDRFGARFPGALVDGGPTSAGGADLILVATPDAAVEAAVTDLVLADVVGEGQRLVHVAGSLGLAPLRRAALAGAMIAACHPAQSVPSAAAGPEVLAGAAWAVTAAPDDRSWARDLVSQLGGTPHEVGEEQRVLYHAGLTIASNAVGAAVSVARQLLAGAAIRDPGAFLAPLVHASVDNVIARGAEAITGPVVRADTSTVAQHLGALDRDVPSLAAAYRALTAVILGQVRATLPPEQASALERVLADGTAGDEA